jgi:hypothetical protein
VRYFLNVIVSEATVSRVDAERLFAFADRIHYTQLIRSAQVRFSHLCNLQSGLGFDPRASAQVERYFQGVGYQGKG